MKFLNPKSKAMREALNAFNYACLHISSPKEVSNYHRQLLGKLNEAREKLENELEETIVIEKGEEGYFHRHTKGMWDSSNTGLKSGVVKIEDVTMKDGKPFWYGIVTLEGGTYYRVDAKQLTYMWYQYDPNRNYYENSVLV